MFAQKINWIVHFAAPLGSGAETIFAVVAYIVSGIVRGCLLIWYFNSFLTNVLEATQDAHFNLLLLACGKCWLKYKTEFDPNNPDTGW